jgi:hypothetical protein
MVNDMSSNPNRNELLRELARIFSPEPRVPWSVWLARQYAPFHAPERAWKLLQEYEAKLAPEPPVKAVVKPERPAKPVVKSKCEAKPMKKSAKPGKANKTSLAYLNKILGAVLAKDRMVELLDSPHSTPRAKVASILQWIIALNDAGLAETLDRDFLALALFTWKKVRDQ